MNYLAHLILSRNYPDDILGNYLADMMTIEEIDEWPEKLKSGVKLHHFIDQFTDTHEVNKVMKRKLRPYFRKYAGVSLDLYYDYFLYQNWNLYSEFPFAEFVQTQYKHIRKRFHHIPIRLHYTVERMIRSNFLHRFTTLDGQSYAFSGLDHRAKFHTGFDQALIVLESHRDEMNRSFNLFFPELIRAVDEFQRSRV